MLPASNNYQSSPDWTIPYRCILPLSLESHGCPHHLDFLFSFFTTMSISPQGSDFFLLTWQLLKDTKNQGATCTTSNATRERAHRGDWIDIKGTSFSSNSRYPLFISIWNDASKRSQSYTARRKDSNERGEGSTGHGDYYFIVLEFLFRSLDIFLTLLLFLCLLFLLLLIGTKRVRITKSDSHLERNSFTTR
ncbi:hypothetical protein EDB82DRAFT_125313 [Fusarium venenatum]|uniref:uncharacterized protein n=1 Tax=Fusarium venenatum TaxID=56646 RepID=UPI001D768818|nr:hypothetical protein EDB82DRAFT_125313 [Fusarium venenatum]